MNDVASWWAVILPKATFATVTPIATILEPVSV